MVQDACGYDWTDGTMLDKAMALFAPLLPPRLRSLLEVTAALVEADMDRPIPSMRTLPHEGYVSAKSMMHGGPYGERMFVTA